MNREEIRAHWLDWANTYGTSLRATTKTATAKVLELDALVRNFQSLMDGGAGIVSVLEVGCGNGENCLHLAKAFPDLRFTGMDFIPEMIAAAVARRDGQGLPANHLRLLPGDVLDLPPSLDSRYDVIFSDRCLINMNSDDLQCRALLNLCDRLPGGGHLMMIENSAQTHGRQNHAREMLGLAPRPPAAFNRFFDEKVILPFLETDCGMEVLKIEDFISLHDLVLYVLVPALNGGKVDYSHPLVEIATSLNLRMSGEEPGAFGGFGQNRLYLCRKKG